MVRQFVDRGDIIWNYPGGGIEDGETPERACIREVLEETGYEIQISKLLSYTNGKYTYEAQIIGGEIGLDRSNADNDDIVEVAWISMQDDSKFDTYTRPILDLIRSN